MKTKKMLKKWQQSQKAINLFINQLVKNYKSMKAKLTKIWCIIALAIVAITQTSCNVTRTMTTESQAFQRGDTAVHIVTKTTEVYNATKNIY